MRRLLVVFGVLLVLVSGRVEAQGGELLLDGTGPARDTVHLAAGELILLVKVSDNARREVVPGPNCVKGKRCGMSCISRSKTCRVGIPTRLVPVRFSAHLENEEGQVLRLTDVTTASYEGAAIATVPEDGNYVLVVRAASSSRWSMTRRGAQGGDVRTR